MRKVYLVFIVLKRMRKRECIVIPSESQILFFKIILFFHAYDYEPVQVENHKPP
jgi:hypothetical protein